MSDMAAGLIVQIVCIVISGVFSVIVTVVGAKTARVAKLSEEHLALRQKETQLSLKIMSANMSLTEATANAVLGRHNNGNVERAYSEAREAKEEYLAFEREVFSQHIHSKSA